jgi:hypothetical protein
MSKPRMMFGGFFFVFRLAVFMQTHSGELTSSQKEEADD